MVRPGLHGARHWRRPREVLFGCSSDGLSLCHPALGRSRDCRRRLTVAQIRNGAACTLATAAASPAQGSAIEDPAPVAPAERPDEAEELLAALVAALFSLRGDAWSALAAAVPVELQQRIDRYFGPS